MNWCKFEQTNQEQSNDISNKINSKAVEKSQWFVTRASRSIKKGKKRLQRLKRAVK